VRYYEQIKLQEVISTGYNCLGTISTSLVLLVACAALVASVSFLFSNHASQNGTIGKVGCLAGLCIFVPYYGPVA